MAAAGDLVENGGFNGSAAGWSLDNPNTNAALYSSGQYEGSGYLATNTFGPGGSIYQDILYPVANGQSFCANAEVEAVGGPTASGTMAVWLLGGGGQDSSSIPINVTSGTWMPVTTCVTATGERSDIRVQFYPTIDAGTIGIDAVQVHPSLVENGGFNGSAAGWSLDNPNTNAALYSSGQYEGSGYLATNTFGPGGSIYQDILYPVANGQSFCANAEVEAVGGPTASGTMAVWLLGGGGQDSSSIPINVTSGTWMPVTTCVTATGERSDIRVQFYPTIDAGTIGIDAVQVQ